MIFYPPLFYPFLFHPFLFQPSFYHCYFILPFIVSFYFPADFLCGFLLYGCWRHHSSSLAFCSVTFVSTFIIIYFNLQSLKTFVNIHRSRRYRCLDMTGLYYPTGIMLQEDSALHRKRSWFSGQIRPGKWEMTPETLQNMIKKEIHLTK